MVYIVFYRWAGEASKKIEAIIREEMDRSGAQEIMMPILQPAEIWKESGSLECVWC